MGGNKVGVVLDWLAMLLKLSLDVGIWLLELLLEVTSGNFLLKTFELFRSIGDAIPYGVLSGIYLLVSVRFKGSFLSDDLLTVGLPVPE